ncbi:MAG: tRNA uridine-5-carboxymethylaminomethyl(34) synthesis GTPase MnmE [Firmicutes bacterium]|nr:tRNA uridine-5-carboxymethylaminomethyl(34) synthesis GTPase MnmE [Bacillota bacterium]
MENTTIAAISTAYGEAGIGIVRMSGPDSLDILKKVFFSKNGKSPAFEARHMYYGTVRKADGEVIDEALAVYMNAPYTYTGEDVAEIQCHGGNISVKNILSLLLESGAVLADRGEFTKRAFLSGKIDLSQAEAVIDLIKARTGRSYETAVDQLEGSVSRRVKEIRERLLDLLVSITVNMDYPDEDIEILTYERFGEALSLIDDELSKLNASSSEGRILREGLKVAIVGKPNVGKSSLMNIFLKENRSIVTDIPGTTRDTIEESASVRGIPISFIDTAGIHESEDVVESMGIERSKEAFNKADLLILVLDGSSELTDEDRELLEMSEGRPCITLLNKADKGLVLKEEGIEVSMLTEQGIDKIEDAIEGFVDSGRVRRESDVMITNIRHADLVRKALSEIGEAMEMVKAREAMDFIEVNVKAAFDYLGEIIGETASDEVIDEVFSRFCLGK